MYCFLKAAFALGVAISAAANAAENDRQVAEDSVRQWNSAIEHRSLDGILALYSQDAMVLQPDGKMVKSQEDIKAFWRSMLDKTAGVMAFDIVDVKGENPDVIVTTAKLSNLKALPDSQRFMRYNYDGYLYSVLKRQHDGSWKAQVQRWN